MTGNNKNPRHNLPPSHFVFSSFIERPVMNLHERISKVQSTNPHFKKDLAIAGKSNKSIGNESQVSSTNRYRIAAEGLGNRANYTSKDIVFVSAEGNRSNRVALHTANFV